MSTTDCPHPLRQRNFWPHIEVMCDKRGVRQKKAVTTGNFMGFPGTQDTGMHAHILMYVIRCAKDALKLCARTEERGGGKRV